MFFLEALDCSNSDLLKIIGIIKGFLTLVQIAIPIMLLLFGTIDLGKAVMAGDEKEIKSATKVLTKRAIVAVVVFLLIFIVQLVTGYVGGDEWKNCWNNASTTFNTEE